MPVSSTRYGIELMRRFKAECGEAGLPCWLCGQPIDYRAPQGDPNAFEGDHVIPSSVDPELADDVDNLRPSHASCNRARSNNAPSFSLGVPSERW